MAGDLITFILVCYRQERFVREAVRSVLAQDYRPLEIILSDDASPDGTYQIIKDEADRYDGPNQVVVNRTPRNLGAINHLNALMKRASGEYIVAGCGDDHFVPERTSRIAALWRETDMPVIASNGYQMTLEGEVMGLALDPSEEPDLSLDYFSKRGVNACVWGAALSWHRDVYDRFGPIDVFKSPFNADHIIPFRGQLLGGNGFIRDPLVYYRNNPQGDSWRAIRRDASEELHDESCTVHHMAQHLYLLDTLSEFRKTRPDDETLIQVQRNLVKLIVQHATDATVRRNRLARKGLTSVWRLVTPTSSALVE